MDSVPSDLSAYLSNKTLKSALKEGGQEYATTSTTAYKISSGISGGTLATAISTIENVDESKLNVVGRAHALSPGMYILNTGNISDGKGMKQLAPQSPSFSRFISLLSQGRILLSVAITRCAVATLQLFNEHKGYLRLNPCWRN